MAHTLAYGLPKMGVTRKSPVPLKPNASHLRPDQDIFRIGVNRVESVWHTWGNVCHSGTYVDILVETCGIREELDPGPCQKLCLLIFGVIRAQSVGSGFGGETGENRLESVWHTWITVWETGLTCWHPGTYGNNRVAFLFIRAVLVPPNATRLSSFNFTQLL